jgi:hypothetical protein
MSTADALIGAAAKSAEKDGSAAVRRSTLDGGPLRTPTRLMPPPMSYEPISRDGRSMFDHDGVVWIGCLPNDTLLCELFGSQVAANASPSGQAPAAQATAVTSALTTAVWTGPRGLS